MYWERKKWEKEVQSESRGGIIDKRWDVKKVTASVWREEEREKTGIERET